MQHRDTPENPRKPVSNAGAKTYKNQHSTDKPLVPVLLTREEAAQTLRCSLRHVDQLRERGQLRDVRLGTRVLIPMSEIHRLIADSMGGGA